MVVIPAGSELFEACMTDLTWGESIPVMRQLARITDQTEKEILRVGAEFVEEVNEQLRTAGDAVSMRTVEAFIEREKGNVHKRIYAAMRRIAYSQAADLDVLPPIEPFDPAKKGTSTRDSYGPLAKLRNKKSPTLPSAEETEKSRTELLNTIYALLRAMLEPEYQPMYDQLIAHPGKIFLAQELLPNVPMTEWRKKKKVLPAMRAMNELFGTYDFRCGAVLRHEPLREEGGYMFLNESCVPFALAQKLTVFQWKVLNQYAAHNAQIVPNRQLTKAVWQKEYEGSMDDRNIQNIVHDIRRRLGVEGYHIVYADRDGADHGFGVNMQSNIPADMRLSLYQAAALSRLILQYQNAVSDDDRWVTVAELRIVLQQAIATVPPGTLTMLRQDAQKTIAKLKKNMLTFGEIEMEQEPGGHHRILRCRLTSWFQKLDEMLPEPKECTIRPTEIGVGGTISRSTLLSIRTKIEEGQGVTKEDGREIA